MGIPPLRSSMVLALFIALCALPLLAYASLTDPGWISGVYDAADGDDVVAQLGETASVQERPPVTAALRCLLCWLLTGAFAPAPSASLLLSTRPRSPPAI